MFNQPYFPLILVGTMLTAVFIFFLIALLMAVRRRINTKNRLISQSLIEERDRTMSMFSLEIHDNVNQVLNVIRMNVHWLLNDANPTQVERLEKIGEMLDTLILDTNNISHTLNNEYLERKGLILALKEETAWVDAAKKLKCNLEISGITRKLNSTAELMIFRIAQEAINNCIKHANCTHIRIRVLYEKFGFSMYIRDNGIGFIMKPEDYKDGIGFSNMLRRASVLDATLTVTSEINMGTEVILTIKNKVLQKLSIVE